MLAPDWSRGCRSGSQLSNPYTPRLQPRNCPGHMLGEWKDGIYKTMVWYTWVYAQYGNFDENFSLHFLTSSLKAIFMHFHRYMDLPGGGIVHPGDIEFFF